MANVSTQRPPPVSDLLALPLELREMVWCHTVVQADSIIITYAYRSRRFENRRTARLKLKNGRALHYVREHRTKLPRLGVMATCRQVRAEVIPIFFRENKFVLLAKPEARPRLGVHILAHTKHIR